MKIIEILKNKKVIILEVFVMILILAVGYYFVLNLKQVPIVTTETSSKQVLSDKFTLFLNATKKNNLDLNTEDLFQKKFVQSLHDFTVIVDKEETRGREDPFSP